jgi:TolA-binding protein
MVESLALEACSLHHQLGQLRSAESQACAGNSQEAPLSAATTGAAAAVEGEQAPPLPPPAATSAELERQLSVLSSKLGQLTLCINSMHQQQQQQQHMLQAQQEQTAVPPTITSEEEGSHPRQALLPASACLSCLLLFMCVRFLWMRPSRRPAVPSQSCICQNACRAWLSPCHHMQ